MEDWFSDIHSITMYENFWHQTNGGQVLDANL